MRQLIRTAVLTSAILCVASSAHAQGSLAHADATYASGDRVQAEREYAALLARDSTQSRAVFRLAQLREARDIHGSIALYRKYVALQPRDAWGYIALGDALGKSGDLSAALAAYDAAARIAPTERDVRVGRARLLARAGHTDASIDAYEAWLASNARDAEAWRELAAQRRRAGRLPEAIAALEQARDSNAKTVERDILRVRALGRGVIEPTVGGSTDSDGLATARAGGQVTSAMLGRARVLASGSADRAGDGTFTRNTQKATVGLQYRPLAQLRLELAGGAERVDRSFVDTIIVTSPGGGGRGGRRPIGIPTAVGRSSFETLPFGRARLAWRLPGDAIAVDARVGRSVLDASPYLVAQGVMRDEASVALDVRVAGPVRVRGFAREGAVHNADESNGRHILGGALAFVPGPYELSLRAQTMTYDKATTLAYFAPRYVRTAELTSYLERETDGGTTIALDLGAGAQQVADWTTAAGAWSPSLRAWSQVVMPLNASLALAGEVEAYQSRVGADTPSLTLPASEWRYVSASVGLRIAF